MRKYTVNILSTVFLVGSIELVRPIEKPVNCYEQYCIKQESGWICQYSGNGRETEFMTDMFCYEDRTQNEREPYRLSRVAIPSWYYDEKLKDPVHKNGHECKYENATRHEYCFCHKPLCNTKLKLPDEFKVDSTLQYLAEPKAGVEVNCYHQYCVERDFGWVCLHSGNGQKTRLLENEYCSEFRSENGEQPKYILRAVSNMHISYDKEFLNKLEKYGESCKYNRTEVDFCLCNKSFCNIKFSLPENFKVDEWLAGSPDTYKEK